MNSRAGCRAEDRAAVMAWRREMRKSLLEHRTALPLEEYQRKSAAVVELLAEEFPTIRRRKVGIYWPYRREIGLFGLANRIMEEGGEISLPVVVAKNQPVEFRAWRTGDPLSTGVYDIPFPRDGAVVRPDVLLIALVGFDASAYRLGYGGGYYDRTLEACHPKPLSIGVGFEFMRLPSIQPLPHDVPLDRIVTEAGVFAAPQT